MASTVQKIWLARHGNRLDFSHPEWFLGAKYPYDPPLAIDGVRQAQELGQRLQREQIQEIWSSPFLRTLETATAIAAHLGRPIHTETGLGEWFNPQWFPQEPQRHPIALTHHLRQTIDPAQQHCHIHPQPEPTPAHLSDRIRRTLDFLMTQFQGPEVIVITHKHPLGQIIWALTGKTIPENVPLCALYGLEKQETKPQEHHWILKERGENDFLSSPQGVTKQYD